MKYFDVEKQAYAIFKTIKHFKPFFIKSHTKVIVPFHVIQNLLVQKDLGEKRAHWVTSLQEYDIEIKPARLCVVKGYIN